MLFRSSLEETKNNTAQFYLANPLGRWGIELKSNGQFIGTIDLHKIDTVLKKAAIGYIINWRIQVGKEFLNERDAVVALGGLGLVFLFADHVSLR